MKHVLDRADRTAPIRRHDLDHTDRLFLGTRLHGEHTQIMKRGLTYACCGGL